MCSRSAIAAVAPRTKTENGRGRQRYFSLTLRRAAFVNGWLRCIGQDECVSEKIWRTGQDENAKPAERGGLAGGAARGGIKKTWRTRQDSNL